MHLTHHVLNIVLGAVVAMGGYGLRVIAQAVDQVPSWVREFGAPTVMLAGTLWALVNVWRELRTERLARIEDRDRMIGQMRDDRDKGDSSREALVRATLEQTSEFKALRRELTRGKPNSGD